MAKATVDGLKKLRRPEDVAKMRGKTIAEVLPWRAPAETPVEPEPEAAGLVAEPSPTEPEAPEPEAAAPAPETVEATTEVEETT